METIDQNEKQSLPSKSMDTQKSSILKQQSSEIGAEQTAQPTKPKKIVFV
jgi:hypothetical protein